MKVEEILYKNSKMRTKLISELKELFSSKVMFKHNISSNSFRVYKTKTGYVLCAGINIFSLGVSRSMKHEVDISNAEMNQIVRKIKLKKLNEIT